MNEPETAGEAAYRAYTAHADARSLVPGLNLPAWHLLDAKIRDAWEEAAIGAVTHRMGVAEEAALPAAGLCLGAATRLLTLGGTEVPGALQPLMIEYLTRPMASGARAGLLDVAGHAIGQVLYTATVIHQAVQSTQGNGDEEHGC